MAMGELEMNPYVIQIDKYVQSLGKLSGLFCLPESECMLPNEGDSQRMCERVSERVCSGCGNEELCLGRDHACTDHLMLEIFRAIENCGTELNVEVKRKVQKYCAQASKFLEEAVRIYREEKTSLFWNRKIAQNRADCAAQMKSFAHLIQCAAKELNAAIFSDEHLENKIRTRCSKLGLRILTTVFLVTATGRYEIRVTVKAKKGQCVTTKEVAQIIGECCGRDMILDKEERAVVGTEFCTVTCVEGPSFHTLCGVAKIGKGRKMVSGDTFSMLDLQGGRQAVVLSDGMGAGESAYRESARVVELLEELLEAGVPQETAVQMLNTAIVLSREEVRFSTIDMCVFDLHQGTCEIIKAGASMTFIKRKDTVQCIRSTSLPIGVVSKLDLEKRDLLLESGDFIIMVTDGVIDALPSGEEEFLMCAMIEGLKITNPKEVAQYLLEQVLICSGQIPSDDMTILTVGIWSLEK